MAGMGGIGGQLKGLASGLIDKVKGMLPKGLESLGGLLDMLKGKLGGESGGAGGKGAQESQAAGAAHEGASSMGAPFDPKQIFKKLLG